MLSRFLGAQPSSPSTGRQATLFLSRLHIAIQNLYIEDETASRIYIAIGHDIRKLTLTEPWLC